ncbi:HNH endonuclease [Rothia nasimurium]|uniref:HNH endonuclease n=1 Tax=Rothia nasimurium TaxID=85336 RepID=UPI001F450632|nr:hypothetical protein [Rothia nasimurium]
MDTQAQYSIAQAHYESVLNRISESKDLQEVFSRVKGSLGIDEFIKYLIFPNKNTYVIACSYSEIYKKLSHITYFPSGRNGQRRYLNTVYKLTISSDDRKRYIRDLYQLQSTSGFQKILPSCPKLKNIDFESNDIFFNIIDILTNDLQILNDAFDKALDYKNFRSAFGNQLKNSYKIKYCPYCNRSPISRNDESDIDHFLIKSRFPLYQSSLWNMIPACISCNQRRKRVSYGGYNPIIQGLESAITIDIFPSTSDKLHDYSASDFQSNIDIKDLTNFEKINEHLEIFKLRSIYKEEDILNECASIYQNLLMNQECMLNMFIQFSNSMKTFEALFRISIEDINNGVLYNSQYGKMRFDTLRRFNDILEKFGIGV